MKNANLHRPHRGFTLIELLMTLVIASIILGIGVPSFRQTIQQNQLTSRINLFTTSLHLARSESIKRGRSVSVCSSSDGASCSGTSYDVGWIVYAESAAIGTREANEELIAINSALETGLTLKGSPAIDDVITFTPSGQVSAAGTFALCKDNDVTKSRELGTLITGRIKLKKPATNCTPP